MRCQLGGAAEVVPEEVGQGIVDAPPTRPHQAVEEHAGRRVLQGVGLHRQRTEAVGLHAGLLGAAQAGEDVAQLVPRESEQQPQGQLQAERAAAGVVVQLVAMVERLAAHRRGRLFPQELGHVAAVDTGEGEVLVLHQVGDGRAEVAVDEDDARLALVLVEVADDLRQGLDLLRRAPASLSRTSRRRRL